FETLDLGRQQRAYPEPRRETLAGATPADFLSALERAAVVHVLAHGVLDPYRERGSGILLGPGAESDGSLWPEDLEHLEPRSRALVVLASCGTAVGPRRTGDDGPTSFASTLLARGASGVITTAARLELRLAEDLTARFHHHLARGQSAAEALRRSKEELGSRDRARAFALAKVRLLGSVAGPFEHQPLIEGRTKTTPWLVGGAVVALLVALLAKLRRSRPPSRRPGALAEPSGVAAVGMRSRRD
ncbi:MAG: CHAT domain-containing protein, partial [Planctomycetota bacterium]